MPDFMPDLVTDTLIAESKPSGPGYLTTVEVARQLGVSRATVYALAAQKKLGHVRVGDSVKITQAHVDEFIAANTVTPTRPAA